MRMTIGVGMVVAAVMWAQEGRFLGLERSIPLAGVEGRIDYMTIDLAGRRLFVAALGNHTVEVIDLAAGRVVHSIKGLGEPQGLLYVTETGRLYAADGADGSCRIYDAADFRLLETVKFDGDADNVRYDAAAKQVWVGYGEGGLGALDSAGRQVADVKLTAHPESFQLERSGGRIFVNVPEAGRIVVVDRVAGRVIAEWPVAEASANFPMALDEAGHRLFVGCRKPAKVLVFDIASGKPAASFAICGDTDDLFFDAGRKRLYVSGGEGFLDVYDTTAGYRRLERITTSPGARTSLFVPDLDRLYLAVRRQGAQGAEIRVYRVAE